jgi:peptidoglycan/LPS O-acetylase OafA/YrhL
MTALIGGVLAILGLLSGVILMLAPLGIGPATPGVVTWLMFPCLTIAGYVLLAMASPTPLALISRLTGGALLVLGLAAVVVLFLAANGLTQPVNDLASLWYVMVVGFILGGAGFSLRRSSAPPHA